MILWYPRVGRNALISTQCSIPYHEREMDRSRKSLSLSGPSVAVDSFRFVVPCSLIKKWLSWRVRATLKRRPPPCLTFVGPFPGTSSETLTLCLLGSLFYSRNEDLEDPSDHSREPYSPVTVCHEKRSRQDARRRKNDRSGCFGCTREDCFSPISRVWSLVPALEIFFLSFCARCLGSFLSERASRLSENFISMLHNHDEKVRPNGFSLFVQ